MSTFKQINANRRNAERMHRPQRPRSRQSRLLHERPENRPRPRPRELMKQESQDEYKQLTADYYLEQFPPSQRHRTSPPRPAHQKRMAHPPLHRCRSPHLRRKPQRHYGGDTGNAFLYQADQLVKLDRIRNSAQRNYHRRHGKGTPRPPQSQKRRHARRRRRCRQSPQKDAKKDQPQPEPTKPLNPELVSFHTFEEHPEPQPQPNPETAPPTEKPLIKAA